MSRARLVLGPGLLCAVAAMLWFSAGFSPDRAAELAAKAGPAGFALYLCLFWVTQPLGMSAHVLLLAAALLWPPAVAFGLGLAGAVGAAVVAFLIARYLAYDYVQAHIPERARRYEQRLVDGGFKAILLVRLVTFTMHPVMYLMGVARVPFGPMLAATIIGFVPAVALDILIGRGVFEWLFG